MKSHTPFCEFVRCANHLQRSSLVSHSPAFPIPLPCLVDMESMPSRLSSRKRSQLYFRRALNLVVLALNFWWSDGKFIDMSLLGRRPSKPPQQIISRFVGFLRVDGPRRPFNLASGGRKMPNLIELSDALTDLGARATPYSKTFPGREVKMQNDGDPVLEPYRSLDADRLRLVGRGHWGPTPFLGDTLAMAFRNPDSILIDRDLTDVELPTIRETEDEIAKLCRVWDKQGLLLLHGCNIPDLFPEETVRIFNAYKSSLHDRQIGGRRGRNAVEARVEGPSRNLPNGTDLCELQVKKGSQSIYISVTARRDFYHQIQASYTRALSNTVGPGVPAWMVEDTSAFSAFLLSRSKKKSDRMKIGDQLHLPSRKGRADSWKGGKMDILYASFKSVLQGDHGGVEYACEGHANLLRDYGLLKEGTRLVSDKPFKGRMLLEGLCIDDYFAVAVQDKDDDRIPRDQECLLRAKHGL